MRMRELLYSNSRENGKKEQNLNIFKRQNYCFRLIDIYEKVN